jgi:hypothetical protein
MDGLEYMESGAKGRLGVMWDPLVLHGRDRRQAWDRRWDAQGNGGGNGESIWFAEHIMTRRGLWRSPGLQMLLNHLG